MEQKKLAIIILNWNGWQDTIECLESLFAGTWQQFSTVIIDNGSKDNSLDKIISWAHERFEFQLYEISDVEKEKIILHKDEFRIILIKSKENLGFAKGCNIGIKYAINADFQKILLLNNDTVVKLDTLQILTEFNENNPQYSVLTPLINYYNQREIVWCLGGKLTFTGRRHFYYYNQNEKKIYKKFKPVTFVTGCALYADIEIFKKFGLLTEKFFVGEEDYHFSLLMKKNNIKMAAVTDSKIYHKVNISKQKILSPDDRLPYMYIGYLSRFIDKKLFCKSMIYWKCWRLLSLSYIIPKLIFIKRFRLKKILCLVKLLIYYSNKLNEIDKEMYFKSKQMLSLKND